MRGSFSSAEERVRHERAQRKPRGGPQARRKTYGARKTPRSVTIAETRCAGVTSKAGFQTGNPSGAERSERKPSTSEGARSSIWMSDPSEMDASIVEVGAT